MTKTVPSPTHGSCSSGRSSVPKEHFVRGLFVVRKPESPKEPPRVIDPTELERIKEELAQRDAHIEALCEAIASHAGYGHRIICAVAKAHGVSIRELIGPRRNRHLVYARQHAMWELRQHTDLSSVQIGVILGNRDHATILHGIKAHAKRMRATQ